MSDFTIIHSEHDGSAIEVVRPENLQFTLNKGEQGPHDISYELSRSSLTAADTVGPYRTDFQLTLDSTGDDPTAIMAGMHTMVSVASDQEMAQFAGKDWLHYLERRYWPYEDTDPDYWRFGHPTAEGDPPTGFAYYVFQDTEHLDSMQIITDILDVMQLMPNSLDLTYSLTNIGHIPTLFTIDTIDTENILSKIQRLSQESPGEFDFWIDWDKTFRVVAPRNYDIAIVDDDSFAEHVFDTSDPGSEVFTVGWTNTGPTQTRLIGTGSNYSTDLAATREYVPGSEQFRLLEGNASFGSSFEPGMVQRRTRQALLFGMNPVHEVTLSVLPETVAGFWTIFKPGKAIWIRADLEVHVIDAPFEIIAMDFSTDTAGNELVAFRLNQIYAAIGLDD